MGARSVLQIRKDIPIKLVCHVNWGAREAEGLFEFIWGKSNFPMDFPMASILPCKFLTL